MPKLDSYENSTIQTADELVASRNGVTVNVTFGSIASQATDSVAITGGSIDNVVFGSASVAGTDTSTTGPVAITSLADKTLNVNLTYAPSATSTAVVFGSFLGATYNSTFGVEGVGHIGGAYNYLLKNGTGTLIWGMGGESRLDANAGVTTLGCGHVFTFGRSNEVGGTIGTGALIYCADISDDGSGTGDSHITNKYAFQNAWANGLVYTAGDITAVGTIMAGRYNIGTPSELTISSGAVTITKGFHSIDTESNAASDDLQVINGGAAGDRLVLRAENDARTVVIKQYVGGSDNILCGSDRTLDHTADVIELIYNGSFWQMLSFNSNA